MIEQLPYYFIIITFRMHHRRYDQVSTCTRKPQCNQIISYVFVVLLLMAEFIALIPHLQNMVAKYVLGAIFIALFLMLALSTVQTSKIDPADPIMVTFLNGERAQVLKVINHCLYCENCRSYVKSTSKHCKICNRCVDDFDHHCIWINNCIGQSNYRWFIVMVLSASLYLLMFIVSVGYIWAQTDWTNFKGWMIILWICLALAIPLFILITLLLFFHFYLIVKKVTTFEYLVGDPNKAKKKGANQLDFQNNTQLHLDNNNNKVKNTFYQSDEIIFRQPHNAEARPEEDHSSSSKEPSQSSYQDKVQNEPSQKQECKHKKPIMKGCVNSQIYPVQKEELLRYKRRSQSLKIFGQSIQVRSLQSKASGEEAEQSVEAMKSKSPATKKTPQIKRTTIH